MEGIPLAGGGLEVERKQLDLGYAPHKCPTYPPDQNCLCHDQQEGLELEMQHPQQRCQPTSPAANTACQRLLPSSISAAARIRHQLHAFLRHAPGPEPTRQLYWMPFAMLRCKVRA